MEITEKGESIALGFELMEQDLGKFVRANKPLSISNSKVNGP